MENFKNFVNSHYEKTDIYHIQVSTKSKEIINVSIPITKFPFPPTDVTWKDELIFRNFMKGLLVGFMEDENDVFYVDVYVGGENDADGIPLYFCIGMSDTEYSKIEMAYIKINNKLYPCYRDVKIDKNFKFGLEWNPNINETIKTVKLMQ